MMRKKDQNPKIADKGKETPKDKKQKTVNPFGQDIELRLDNYIEQEIEQQSTDEGEKTTNELIEAINPINFVETEKVLKNMPNAPKSLSKEEKRNMVRKAHSIC